MIMNYRIMENVATLARTILCVKGESRAYAEGRTGDPDDSRSSQQNDLTFFFSLKCYHFLRFEGQSGSHISFLLKIFIGSVRTNE